MANSPLPWKVSTDGNDFHIKDANGEVVALVYFNHTGSIYRKRVEANADLLTEMIEKFISPDIILKIAQQTGITEEQVKSVANTILNEHKIQAIKEMRTLSGLSLKEAKAAVDALQNSLRRPTGS